MLFRSDMEPGEGNGALIIPNGLMEIWDATEEDLYRAGMENLRRKDKCFAVDMLSFIRGAVSAEVLKGITDIEGGLHG